MGQVAVGRPDEIEIELLRLLGARSSTRAMVDVGAHHGTTLEPFLAAGFDVYAFEPLESNRTRLRERLGERPTLTVRGEAVSRASGTAELQLAVREDGSRHDHYHSLERIGVDEHHRKGETVVVPTVSLDDLVARGELPVSVGVLKIDTVGHDLAVLEGSASLSPEVVEVEYWMPAHPLGASPSPAERMVELMAERGYPQYVAIEHSEHGGGTAFHFGSLAEIDEAAWGNILFFRADREGLYEEVRNRCRHGLSPLQRLLLRLFPGREGLRFCDVGAYQGDFAVEVLELFPASQGVLFEPSTENAGLIEERLGADPRIVLRRLALSDEEGAATFRFLPRAPYSSSLLAPAGADQEAELRSVSVSTLDRVAEGIDRLGVDVIKVDAQGADLRVLLGAERTIAEHAPVLIVEAIFIPLYEGQAEPHEILAYAAQRGYRLMRMLNIHHTRADELAFADLVLAKSPLLSGDRTPPSIPIADDFVPWSPDDGAALPELHEHIDPLTRPQVGDWVVPWEVTDPAACYWYHAFDLPGIGEVGGGWDLRGSIDAYLGGGSLEGLTFLDLGTASGFVSFAAERRGARVISYDIGDARKELQPHLLPRLENEARRDELLDEAERNVESMKRSYWLAHRLLASEAKAYYGDLYRLSELLYPVDVVHVGQILVHLRDPVGALTEAGRLARKRLVIVEGSMPTEEPFARLLANAKMKGDRSWWHFSIGFYRNFLEILGFEIEDVEVERHLCPARDDWFELKTITAVRTEG